MSRELQSMLLQFGVKLTISGSKHWLDSKFTSFAVYIIDVSIGQYKSKIYRRYNQFHQLDSELRILFPKEKLEELPRKTFIRSKTDKELVNLRAKHLQKYLDRIVQIENIIKSEVFAKWLSPNQNVKFKPLLSIYTNNLNHQKPLFFSLDNPDHTGILLKQGHVVRNWKERYFVLKNDLLYYFRTKEDMNPLGVVPLKNSIVETAEKLREFCFKIIPGSLQLQPFFMCSSTKQDFIKWVEVLHRASLNYSDKKQIKAVRVGSDVYVPDQSENSPPHDEGNRNNNNNDGSNSNTPSRQRRSKSSLVIENQPSNRPKSKLGDINDSSILSQSYPVKKYDQLDEKNNNNNNNNDVNIILKSPILSSLELQRDKIPEIKRTNSDGDLASSLSNDVLRKLKKKRMAEMEADSIQEILYQTKQMVDDELVEFLSSINFAIVKVRFLDIQEKKQTNANFTFFEKLKNLTNNFLSFEINDLLEGDTCKTTISNIQTLSVEYSSPTLRSYVTSLLFIISPITRLVSYQKYESKKKLAKIEENIKIPLTKTDQSKKPHQQLTSLLIDCVQLLGVGFGVSLEKTLKTSNHQSTSVLHSPKVQKHHRNSLLTKSDPYLHKPVFQPANHFPPYPQNHSGANSPSLSNSSSNSSLSSEISDSESNQDAARKEQEWSVNKLLSQLQNQREMNLKEKEVEEEEVKAVSFQCPYCSEEIHLHHMIDHDFHCKIATEFFNEYQSNTNSLEQTIEKYKESITKIPHEESTKQLSQSLSKLTRLIDNISSKSVDNASEKDFHELKELIEKSKSRENVVYIYAQRIETILRDKYKPIVPKIKIEKERRRTQSVLRDESQSAITIHSFEMIKPISCGAFGRVDLVRKIGTDQLFAMKTLRKRDMIDKNLVEQVRTERNILSSTQNPYVVKMFYAFHDSKKLYLLMEYLNGGDCASLLENVGYFEEEMARLYIAETIMAIAYLHSKGIVHRDVKPDNLLISTTGHIKLTDFGLSREGLLDRNPTEVSMIDFNRRKLLPAQRPQRVVGTPDYLSPEALLGIGSGKMVDWWAVGVTLFEFLTGIPPFNDETPEKIFQNIFNRDIPWPVVPDEMSEEAFDLIDKLLQIDPSMRLGFKGVEEIKSHPFFCDINWDTLYLEPRLNTFVPIPRDQFDTGYFVPRNQYDHVNSFSTLNEEEQARKDELFAGFSWRHLPTEEQLASMNLTISSTSTELQDKDSDDDDLTGTSPPSVDPSNFRLDLSNGEL